MKRILVIVAAALVVAWPAWADNTRAVEDQTPTGKFLNATEVRPILGATKGSWIAVREFGDHDLLYFTHLLSWRCGLYEVNFAINGGEAKVFPIPDCNPESPNSIPSEATIYLQYPLNSIETIDIELLYDDLAKEAAHFERKNVMTP